MVSLQRGFEYRITWEQIEETFDILMASSAIRRGDAEELDALLQQGQSLTQCSSRFHLTPMDLAAKRGNADIIRVLIKRGCETRFFFRYNWTDVLSVAPRSSNREALEVWIQDMKDRSGVDVGYCLGVRYSQCGTAWKS
ncbi:hypothetical protein BBP40_002508 [Aspergillus hancockii]|nr:hypothetical protein BBP40_002508 [Aspergillus hancockii]